MIDDVRREAARRKLAAAVAEETAVALAPATDGESRSIRTIRSILLFMCCHPALTSASAIALTLRAVGGLTTAQIAKSFLVPELTSATHQPSKAEHHGIGDPLPGARRQ